VKIVTQTGGSHRSSLVGGWLAATLALLDPTGAAEAQTGEIHCRITENGIPAHGTIAIERDGRKIGGGPCSQAVSVPEGKCMATVRLDGPLDNPSKSIEVRVVAGKAAPVTVDFQTGVLEVRIEAKGQGGTGMVTLNRGSKRIGTLASGVATRLSAGSYEVVVRLGGQERRYPIDLRAGQRRVVRAQF
jgi:hypothetical protein